MVMMLREGTVVFSGRGTNLVATGLKYRNAMVDDSDGYPKVSGDLSIVTISDDLARIHDSSVYRTKRIGAAEMRMVQLNECQSAGGSTCGGQTDMSQCISTVNEFTQALIGGPSRCYSCAFHGSIDGV